MPAAHVRMLPSEFQRTDGPRLNPRWADAEKAFEDYARRTGVIAEDKEAQLLLSFGFGRFTAICYPALPWSQLELLTQWHYMLTIIDDVGDKAHAAGGAASARQLRDGILRAIDADERPDPGTRPAAAAFHDLWHRTRPRQPHPRAERILANLANLFHQFVVQRHNRQTAREFELQDYIDLRRMSVGLDLNADLIEQILDLKIPEPVFTTAPLRELRNCFVDANAWLNDYCSFESDVAEGDPHNLALVIAASTGRTHEQALDRTMEMITQRLHRFLRIEKNLPDLVRSLDYDEHAASEVLRYSAALKEYTYGHVYWSSTSSRYTNDRLRAPDWAELGN